MYILVGSKSIKILKIETEERFFLLRWHQILDFLELNVVMLGILFLIVLKMSEKLNYRNLEHHYTL